MLIIYGANSIGNGTICADGVQRSGNYLNKYWYSNGATGGGSVNIFIKIGGNVSETQKISATGPETYPGSVKKAGDGSVTITYIKDIEI